MEYRSEALMVCHQDAKGLHSMGIIDDERMREYDRDCLVQESEPESATEQTIGLVRQLDRT